MAAHDFQFTLVLSDEPHFEPMLADLVGAVLQHVGYAPDAIAEVAAALRDERARGAAAGRHRCRVAFEARDGELRIGIAFDGAEERRIARRLP